MKLSLPDINSLIEQGRIKEQHPLYNLSDDDRTVIDEAIGIAHNKFQESGKGVNALLGDLCHREKYQGLLGELYWCYRLTQLGYFFKTEAKEGKKDLRIELDNRIVGAEVKTIQKPIVTDQETDLNKRLRKSVHKLIDNNQVKCNIFISIRQNFSDKSIKPIAKKIKDVVEGFSLSQKKCTLYYPDDSGGTYGCQAEVTIEPYEGKNHSIKFVLPTVLMNDDKLLRSRLKEAISQLDKHGVNVVFVDKTFRPMLVEEDILITLYGSSLGEQAYFTQGNDGFFKTTSRISAVIIYERNGYHDISSIRECEIYPHPEHCKLTKSELKLLRKLCNV